MSIGATVDLSVTVGAVAKELAASARQIDSLGEFPAKNIRLLGEGGLLGLLVRPELGGLGAGAELFANTAQTIGGACASTGMIFVMHCCAVETIAKHQSGLSELLKQAARGQHLSTLACSERGTGANFYASDSTSKESEDGFVLSGEKAFVTSAGYADSYVASARAVGSQSCTDTTMYLLRKDNPGVEFTGRWEGLGLRGNNSISLNLNDCRVAASDQIGSQGQGLEIEMSTVLPRFLLGVSAVYNGIAQSALTATVEHLKVRQHTHTGEKLNALAVLRNKIARMAVSVDSSVALMQGAARSWDATGSAALVELLKSKQIACRTAVEVATMAMEACGGIAYSNALPIERHLRDSQAGVVMAPTNDILLDLIGKATLGMPLM